MASDTPVDVLYVDDEPINVLLMQALFEHRPQLRLHTAGDGRSARAVASDLHPALLLLDLRLPDCHGTTLLRELRKLQGLSDHVAVPAVAVTAEYNFAAEDSGFDEVWSKPLDMRRMLDRLDHWVAVGNASRPLAS
jgi:CheY-like chemotaxis protein